MKLARKIGAHLKPTIILSGVNIANTGILTIFIDALTSLSAEYLETYNIVALVHKKSLFDIPGITFVEYPEIKSSWLKRLRFEYYECRAISEQIKPYLWFAMHDMTPAVRAEVRAVYCHNASAFYPFSVKEGRLDWKLGLFTLLYRYLYRINIRSNDFVVVQQDWMRSEFRSQYRLSNIVVAHPSVDHLEVPMCRNVQPRPDSPYIFFYPAYPRTFKNIEQVLRAARNLESRNFNRFEVWLTMDGSETSYAAKILRDFSDLTTVKWLGLLPRSEVVQRYGEADCLIFPSKLESWGMPITEFKATEKPILAADLPYAHETVGKYGKVAFFGIDDDAPLAVMMQQAATGRNIFGPTEERPIDQPFSSNWRELWNILLNSSDR